MYFDLNVPVSQLLSIHGNKKGKGKQVDRFTRPQIADIESRVDLLVHLGYSVIGFAHTVHRRVEKTHVNILDTLLPALRRRDGVLYLKRLNIVLDEDSEKGFGLINASIPLFSTYDLIALIPTTHATFSLACLTHSQPSPLTAHVIAVPLTIPRLPFHMKHTLVRTAIKNGAVFEINYVGAIGGEQDPVLVQAGAAEAGASAKRNWWATARELVRVTKGKGLLLSGGTASTEDLRAPRDVGNLITMLGLPQDASHAMATTAAKSLVLRAQTRKTYRAIFSEPELVVPGSKIEGVPKEDPTTEADMTVKPVTQTSEAAASTKKRALDETVSPTNTDKGVQITNHDLAEKQDTSRKKKRKKSRHPNPTPST